MLRIVSVNVHEAVRVFGCDRRRSLKGNVTSIGAHAECRCVTDGGDTPDGSGLEVAPIDVANVEIGTSSTSQVGDIATIGAHDGRACRAVGGERSVDIGTRENCFIGRGVVPKDVDPSVGIAGHECSVHGIECHKLAVAADAECRTDACCDCGESQFCLVVRPIAVHRCHTTIGKHRRRGCGRGDQIVVVTFESEVATIRTEHRRSDEHAWTERLSVLCL